MPKMKTHRGAAKRFARTSGGKLKRRHSHGSHLLEKKSSSRKRRFQGVETVSGSDTNQLRRLLPNR
jgi:large subunit ribosomal protein L35